MSPYVRKVPTASGAKAVQIIWSKKRGHAEVEHIGSAHDEAELELLTAAAQQRIHAGQDELDLGLPVGDQSSVEILGTRMGRLLDAISAVYRQLGFDTVAQAWSSMVAIAVRRAPTENWQPALTIAAINPGW